MSCCDWNVIANSTFSWWGAFFKPNQDQVLYPNRWFNTSTPADLMLEKWICLSCFVFCLGTFLNKIRVQYQLNKIRRSFRKDTKQLRICISIELSCFVFCLGTFLNKIRVQYQLNKIRRSFRKDTKQLRIEPVV